MRDPRDDLPYHCDLVMKGGITSGVVYPPAIVEIARDHRLHRIGGSSAGAIAASAAAAAELGRGVDGGGFERLARLPVDLAVTDDSGRTLLQRLFQAQPATTDAFDLFWTWRSTAPKARVRAMLAAVRRHGRAPLGLHAAGVFLLGLAVALFVASAGDEDGWGVLGGGALIVLTLLLWVLAAVAAQIGDGGLRLGRATVAGVNGNRFGICNGFALVDWLHTTIQELAGRTGVVTYADLATVDVDLVTMTTDLTHGTAEPFPLAGKVWAFAEADMRALFPDTVVQHLLEHSRPPEDDEDLRDALLAAGLHALPAAADLPILLGARISLSFPLLLSAVPLYAWSPRPGPDGSWTMALVRCWFSDGGITSNLPVHLFDKPLPTRPTYAINLGGGGDGLPDCDRIRRPIRAVSGQRPPTQDIDSAVGLGSALFDTMQNWSDNALIRAPGYRDRICTVRLAEGEGGMNLDMPPATIAALAERGRAAGQNLAWIQRGAAGRPDCPPPVGLDDAVLDNQWERHRFTRYRTFLGGLAGYLGDAAPGFTKPGGDYGALGQAALGDASLPYRTGWTANRATASQEHVNAMFGPALKSMANHAPAGSALGFDARARPAEADDE